VTPRAGAARRQAARRLALAAAALALATPRAGAAPTIAVGTATGTPGQTVAVPVTFDCDGATAALQLDVLYDATRVAPAVLAPGAAVGPAGHSLDGAVIAPGRLRLLIVADAAEPLPCGTAADLSFTIDASVHGSLVPLDVEAVEMVDAASRLGQAAATPGGIVIDAPCRPGDVNPIAGAADGHLRRWTSDSAPLTYQNVRSGRLASSA
jgi:hypothetical protein